MTPKKNNKEQSSSEEFANKLDSLKGLKRGLYRKKGGPVQGRVEHTLQEKDHGIEEDWNSEPKEELLNDDEVSSSPWIKRIFIVSLLFFMASLGVVAYIIYGGSNVVSSKNIDIEIAGPVSVGGGEEFSLQLSMANHNSVPLELADLIIEFPDGTRSPDNLSEDLLRSRKSLGNIDSGEVVNELITAVFFGEENDKKDIDITLEYRVVGSNAIFVKEETYSLTINTSPVSLLVSGVKEVSANQELRLDIEVVSNSDTVINDLVVKIDYPFGFEFIDSSPPSTFGENSWRLGDFAPGSKRKVTVNGLLKGQDGEKKFFKVYTGTQSTENEKEIGVVYNSSFQEVALRQPFLGATVVMGGEVGSEYVAESNEKVTVEILWANNLPVRITDAQIEVSVSGEVIDESLIAVERGVYDSIRNVVMWDKRVIPELGVIESGESGRVKFSLSPKSVGRSDIKNPEVSLEVSVKGNRSSESNVPEKVESFVNNVIKFTSNASLTSRAVYNVGPFQNRGPIPPRAEQETTYTIIWTVLNTSNNLSSVLVKGSLPSYVKWLNAVSPANEKISYNQTTGEIIWLIGDVASGTGTNSPAKEVAFQVTLLPSINQVGDSPDLLLETLFSAEDNFTGKEINSTSRAITTKLSTDPGFNLQDSKVAP